MTPKKFINWLEGFLEASEEKSLDAKKTEVVRNKLQSVFEKRTPIREIPKVEQLGSITLRDVPNIKGKKIC